MTDNAFVKVRRIKDVNGSYHSLMLWCPGCVEHDPEKASGGLNMIPVSGNPDYHPVWSWNGDLVKTTVTPSILSQIKLPEFNFVCHSFLTDGVWNFLTDSTHDLAGKSVPMEPLPDWCFRE